MEASSAQAHDGSRGAVRRRRAPVKDRIDGKRAALSQARRLTREGMHILARLGGDAFTHC